MILEGDFVGDGFAIFGGDDAEGVLAGGEGRHPAESCGGEVLAVAVFCAEVFAVEEEFGGVAVGVDLDHLLFAGGAPADGPGVAVDVGHGGFGPVGLKDVVGLFFREVAFDDAFLIDARDGVFGAKGSGEILEDPLGGAGEPSERLLNFEVPVEEVAGVGFGPVAVLGDTGRASGVEIGEAALVGAVASGDFGENFVGVFGVAAGVAVGSPLGVEEMVDAVALGFEGLLIFGIGSAVPAGPDGG